MGGLDVGVFVLHPLNGFTGRAFRPTPRAVPRAAALAFHKGLAALSRKDPKYKQAIEHLGKAAEAYPQFVAAWWALARRGRASKTTQVPVRPTCGRWEPIRSICGRMNL